MTPQASPLVSIHALSRSLTLRGCLLVLLAALHGPAGAQSTQTPATVDAYTEVGRLMRAGQIDEAMSRADRYLQAQPRDPQMRFMKGVLQSQKGQSADAMVTFQRLTDEFPELPEPHNNLAALLARQNRYAEALDALQAAVRARPDYATALENLGDVYIALAMEAYQNANKAMPSQPRAASKRLAAEQLLKSSAP